MVVLPLDCLNPRDFTDDGDEDRNSGILDLTKGAKSAVAVWALLDNEEIEVNGQELFDNPQAHVQVSSRGIDYLIRMDLYKMVDAGEGKANETINVLLRRPAEGRMGPPCRPGIDYFYGMTDGDCCLMRYLEAIGWEPRAQTTWL